MARGLTPQHATTAVAIAFAESGLRTDAVGRNRATPGCPFGSRDRGLWQINDCYHPSIGDQCAFDPACNAQAMDAISSHGTNWNPWSTYGNGAYRQYIAAASIAVASVQGGLTVSLPSAPVFDLVSYTKSLIDQGKNPFDAVRWGFVKLFDYIGSQLGS